MTKFLAEKVATPAEPEEAAVEAADEVDDGRFGKDQSAVQRRSIAERLAGDWEFICREDLPEGAEPVRSASGHLIKRFVYHLREKTTGEEIVVGAGEMERYIGISADAELRRERARLASQRSRARRAKRRNESFRSAFAVDDLPEVSQDLRAFHYLPEGGPVPAKFEPERPNTFAATVTQFEGPLWEDEEDYRRHLVRNFYPGG